MKNPLRTILPYLFLAVFAIALLVIRLKIAPEYFGYGQVFLIVAASLLGLRSGLIAAAYASLVLTGLKIGPAGSQGSPLVVEIVLYLTIAAGIGLVVEKYRAAEVLMAKDIAARKETEEKLKYLSFHDNLTGLKNRAYFDDVLGAAADQLPVSIIMGDVNGLKLVNDTLGHAAGDELLVAAALILSSACRNTDIVCRSGGDEFMIILPHTPKSGAQIICDDIAQRCRTTAATPLPLSISLGIATREHLSRNIRETIKEAEDMMYRNKILRIRDTRYAYVGSLQSLLQEKTEETIEHALRLKKYVLGMGEKLKLPAKLQDELSLLATLHDIGKIAIPDSIIMKKESLTPNEWDIIRKHPEIGYRIVVSVPEINHIAEDILHHHERWDGGGYPHGLKGEEIPYLSRILAIADSYDVMTTGRAYKAVMSHTAAVGELKKCSGTHFDPYLVEVFISALSMHYAI